MPAPATTSDFLDVVAKSRLVEPPDLDEFRSRHPALSDEPKALAKALISDGLLTPFQSEQLLRGKYRGFVLGKYKLLDRIGLGGMGQVFLAEHGIMRKRVALKVLPPDRSSNEFARERFVREARTTGQLDHPNLIKAYDLDGDGDVHFLVLEYVDGLSLQDLVTRNGPLDAHRAAYYLWQAASGLSYLSGRGLVHRDIKPANLIVDRVGAVKILDLGLVREEDGGDDLTRREDVKFLGTADYLAPEQLASCSTVDVRADLYGLGATGYFLLTGKPPYAGATVAQKLIAAQTSEARACHLVNPTVPVELSVVITKLLAKKAADRYQTPGDLLAVLDRWAETPPDPPGEAEFPNRDGSQSAPLPNSAVALSFNLMKAARGGSGGSSSAHILNKQASSSSLRLHADVAGTPNPSASDSPTAENCKGETKVSHSVVDTPTPGIVATPAPVAVSPLKTVAPRGREPKPAGVAKPKAPRPPKAAPPPIPVLGLSAFSAKNTDPKALVDMDALRERAARATSEVAAERANPASPSTGGFWGFLKSLFGRRKKADSPVPTIRDSSVLG
jgi:serine/threonine protein kinase